jgi:hypothetical protein
MVLLSSILAHLDPMRILIVDEDYPSDQSEKKNGELNRSPPSPSFVRSLLPQIKKSDADDHQRYVQRRLSREHTNESNWREGCISCGENLEKLG